MKERHLDMLVAHRQEMWKYYDNDDDDDDDTRHYYDDLDGKLAIDCNFTKHLGTNVQGLLSSSGLSDLFVL